MLNVEDNNGEIPYDITVKENTPRHTELAKCLKAYMKQNPLLPPKGPTALWTFYLLLPFLWMSFVFITCNYYLSSSSYSGTFIIIALVTMYAFVARQSHRIPHISRWQNPIFLGLFLGSVSHCAVAYLVKIFTSTYQTHYITTMILAVSTFTYVTHMYTLIFDDAGTLKQHHLIHAFGKPLNIVDVPSGRCKEFDFCPFTETIRPPNSKYCRICEKVIMNLDHHCLYVYNCVANDNHKAFVVMLFAIMTMQTTFVVSMYQYMSQQIPAATSSVAADASGSPQMTLSVASDVAGMIFHKEPWFLALLIVCTVAFFGEAILVATQFRSILRAETSYFPRKGRHFSCSEMFMNCFRFFCKPKLRFVEKNHEEKTPFLSSVAP